MKRLEQTPEVRRAANEGRAVVACVYQGWVPAEITSQLPEGLNSGSWAAEIVEGRVTRLVQGTPEAIVPQLIASAGR